MMHVFDTPEDAIRRWPVCECGSTRFEIWAVGPDLDKGTGLYRFNVCCANCAEQSNTMVSRQPVMFVCLEMDSRELSGD